MGKPSKKKVHYVYKDAETGEFVSPEFAKKNPKTTIRERVTNGSAK